MTIFYVLCAIALIILFTQVPWINGDNFDVIVGHGLCVFSLILLIIGLVKELS